MKKILSVLITATCSINCFAQLPSWLPTNGLVAWYPFNGNANDESGNANNGIVYGAVKIKDRFGNITSAYKFDGTTYIKGSSANFPIQNRTISLWYKIDDWANHNTLMGYGGGVCGTSFFATLNHGDNHKFFTSSHCNVNTALTDSNYLENSEWTNFIITANGTKTTFYLNGIKIYDAVVNYYGTDIINKNFALGSMSSPSGYAPYSDGNVSYLKGSLDDIAIYNRVLDSTEIHQLYCSCIEPSINISNKTIFEGNSGTKQLKFPVKLSNTYTSPVKIKYKTSNNTANAGTDYIRVIDSLVFMPGQTNKTISVTIIGDTKPEPDETFYVSLFKPVNATIVNDTAIGKIRNDDSAALTDEFVTSENIQSKLLDPGFKVFPNPVKDVLYIQTTKAATFYLSDAKGKLILAKQIHNKGSISVSALPAGLYFIKNELTGKLQKIVVQK